VLKASKPPVLSMKLLVVPTGPVKSMLHPGPQPTMKGVFTVCRAKVWFQ
jgi:hypothetical protein